MAFKLAEAFVDIVGKTNGVEGTLDGLHSRLGRAVDAFGQGAAKIGSAMTKIGAAITAGSGLSLKLAMDAEESENLFEESFGRMADAARAWSEAFSKSVGLNAYEVRRMSGTLYVMLDSMGLGEQKAYDMATAMTRLAYDMASFYNLSPDEAYEKLQAGITGEAEPLKRLGIILLDTQLKQQALKMGLDGNTQAMDEATKVAVRFAAIMDQTAKAQGDLARTMDSPTNRLRMMKSQLTEMGIEIGRTLIPAFTSLLTRVQSMIPAIERFAANHGDLIVNVSLLGAAFVALGPALMAIQPAIGILGAIGGALTTIGGLLGGWPVMIGAVVAGGIALLSNWDKIKEWATNHWPMIGSQMDYLWWSLEQKFPILGTVKDKFMEMTAGIRGQLAEWWADHREYFGPIWEQMKAFALFTKDQLAVWFKQAWERVMGPALKAFFDGAMANLGALIRFLGGDWKGAWMELERFWYALFDRLSARLKKVLDGMRQALNDMIWSIKNALGMNPTGEQLVTNYSRQRAAQGGAGVNVGGITINGAQSPQATARAVQQALVDSQRFGMSSGMLAAMP